jgi:hypothetical protein
VPALSQKGRCHSRSALSPPPVSKTAGVTGTQHQTPRPPCMLTRCSRWPERASQKPQVWSSEAVISKLHTSVHVARPIERFVPVKLIDVAKLIEISVAIKAAAAFSNVCVHACSSVNLAAKMCGTPVDAHYIPDSCLMAPEIMYRCHVYARRV